MSDVPDSAGSSPTIRVEVVHAGTNGSIACSAVVASGATVEEAIDASGIRKALPSDFTPAAIGIYGRVVDARASLRDGDRIELYRALRLDPKQARRRRAEKQARPRRG